MIMSWSKWTRALIEPIVQIFKPIPPLALAPFMILWFGLGLEGILFLVIWGCFFVMVIDATEAIRTVSPIWIWAASALGHSKRSIYFRVILPSILPHILGGLRISMVMAFNQVMLAEFNVASGGIGELVIKGYRFTRVDLLFLGIISIVSVAVLMDFLLILVGRKVTKWAEV
jgi:ABC-type nitrate/sulfonate/bicarbonate transport system permease component